MLCYTAHGEHLPHISNRCLSTQTESPNRLRPAASAWLGSRRLAFPRSPNCLHKLFVPDLPPEVTTRAVYEQTRQRFRVVGGQVKPRQSLGFRDNSVTHSERQGGVGEERQQASTATAE